METVSMWGKTRITLKHCQHFFHKVLHHPLQVLNFKWLHHYWYKSIQRQLILGIALVHAILMTIFVIDLTERQREFLQREAMQQALGLAETLAANSSSWTLASDVMGLSELVKYQLRYPGMQYALNHLKPWSSIGSHRRSVDWTIFTR